MILNLKTVSSKTRDEIIVHMETLSTPAVLTDGKLVIIEKNCLASSATPGSRKGGRLDRFLRAGDIDILMSMNPREIFSTELRFEDSVPHDTIAVAGVGWRLFVFSPVGAGLCRRVNELYGSMSGYDIVPSDGVLSPEHSPNKKFASLLSRMLFASADEFKRARGLPFFNASAVLDTLKSCIYESRDGTRGAVKIGAFGRDLVTEGSARDLALLMGYIISFCIDIRGDSTVCVNVATADDTLVLSVECVSSLDSLGLARLASLHKSSPGIGDRDFWLYMVRLLVDGNLWDMSVDVDLDGRVSVSVALPRVEVTEEIVLRDPRADELYAVFSLFFPADC